MDKRFYCEYGLIIDRTKIGIEENVTIFDEDFGTLDDICDLLNKQNEIIADLEAKLDEKTRVAEGYSELFDKRQHENYEQFCEIQELKAKLTESEKAFDTISAKYEKKSKQIFEIIKKEKSR